VIVQVILELVSVIPLLQLWDRRGIFVGIESSHILSPCTCCYHYCAVMYIIVTDNGDLSGYQVSLADIVGKYPNSDGSHCISPAILTHLRQ
jgi:hypothetical protein